jgi:hypothetical protein
MPSWIVAPFDPANGGWVAGWGFWFGLIGLLLTLIGFAITWVQLARAKSVAVAARDEAARIQLSLKRHDAVQEATRAKGALEAAKRHVRKQEWEDGGERLDEFRRHIISLRSSVPGLSDGLLSQIDSAVSYVSKLCARIDRASASGANIDFAKTVSVLRTHDEMIERVLDEVERAVFK